MDEASPQSTAETVPPQVAPALPPDAATDEVIRHLEREFPGWGVWHSDARRWWAFRTAANPLTIDQLRAGCRLIVQADAAVQLRAAIQAEIELAHRAG